MQLSKTQPQISPVSYEEYKANQAKRAKGNSEMGQQEFLNLLIAQMKNQDPLSPMENAEFTAQTTAFSQLEQMINMNKALTEMLEMQQSSNNIDQQLMDAASFIGKKIEYATNTLAITDSGTSPISFYSSDAAPSATVSIYNEEGSLVGTVTIDNVKKGANAISWNGSGDGGVKLPEGMYTFQVSGKTASGSTITTSAYGEGEVKGVSMSGGKLYFEVENGLVPAEYVYGVKQVPAAATDDSSEG